MRTLAIEVPDELEFALGCPHAADLDHLLRVLLAVKLYESGRAASGQAAVVAGLSRRAFLLEVPKYGVPSVLGDADEVVAESTDL